MFASASPCDWLETGPGCMPTLSQLVLETLTSPCDPAKRSRQSRWTKKPMCLIINVSFFVYKNHQSVLTDSLNNLPNLFFDCWTLATVPNTITLPLRVSDVALGTSVSITSNHLHATYLSTCVPNYTQQTSKTGMCALYLYNLCSSSPFVIPQKIIKWFLNPSPSGYLGLNWILELTAATI